MKQNKGFTLIELLIALTLFAILATITSSSLYYAFNTRTKVNLQADRLSELQLAISMIEQDTAQVVARATRGNEMRLFPTLIGQPHYVEFTRDGLINPNSLEQRSTLKRVAYLCEQGAFLRRTWDSLDSINRNHYSDRVLITHVSSCHFNYLNHNVQVFDQWREQTREQESSVIQLPTAIQINLTLADWDKLSLLFAIPEALYASV